MQESQNQREGSMRRLRHPWLLPEKRRTTSPGHRHLQKLEKAGKRILPRSLQKEPSPAKSLIVAQGDLDQGSDLQNRNNEFVLSH